MSAANVTERDIYVNNVFSSLKNESDMLMYFSEIRIDVYDLRAQNTNSETLRIQATADGVLDSDAIIKILELRWDPSKDEMSIGERNIPIMDVLTTRIYSSICYRFMIPGPPKSCLRRCEYIAARAVERQIRLGHTVTGSYTRNLEQAGKIIQQSNRNEVYQKTTTSSKHRH